MRRERIYWDKTSRAVIGNGRVVQLTPQEAEIFDVLWPPSVAFIMAKEINARLGSRFHISPHGGIPAIVKRAIKLRELLTPLGIILEGHRARDRGGYRIVVPRAEQTKRAA